MKFVPYKTQGERQIIIDSIPADELLIGERNINLDENGIPQTNEIIIEDDPTEVARILEEQRQAQEDARREAEKAAEHEDALEALALLGVEVEDDAEVS